MCLGGETIKKYKKPRDWVEGYKVLTYHHGWQSIWSRQIWEFAKMVEVSQVSRDFWGVTSRYYDYGIHAYKNLRWAHSGRVRLCRVVKVLLFNVTHEDSTCYRADKAIIVEALDWDGNRMPW